MSTHGLCSRCGSLKALDAEGWIVFHRIGIDVTRKAVKAVGSGRVKRRCPGSGQPPRRVEK